MATPRRKPTVKPPASLEDHPELNPAWDERNGGDSSGDGRKADRSALERAAMNTGLDPVILKQARKARGDTRPVIVGGIPNIDRRRSFNEERRTEYLDYMSRGVAWPQAAELVGIHWSQVDQYRAMEPSFAEQERRATQISVERLQGTAYRSAEEFGSQPALEWVSKQLYPEKFIPDAARAKLAVTIDGTVIHELTASESLQHIAALQAKLEERKALLSGSFEDAEIVEPEDA